MRHSRLYQRLLDGSLRQQRDLATVLLGARGERVVSRWLDEEVAKVDDPAYVRLFTDHVDLPGVAPADYAHRLVETSHGGLLGGIRFYGRDVERPFVDVVAHDFDDLDALRRSVHREWSTFRVAFARLRGRPGAVDGQRVLADHGVYLARYRDMPPPDGRVSLAPFATAEAAVDLVRRRYERVAADAPALGRNLAPADADDLRQWHAAGRLTSIVVGGDVVGAFAVAPGRIDWIEGEEIQEEVVDAGHAGHGYAASAQRAWAAGEADRDRFLVGTVDAQNHASRRTAARAGRSCVLEDVFLLLP